MSFLMTENINLAAGVDPLTFNAHGEYTSKEVADNFQYSLAAFANIFNLGLDPNIDGVDPSADDVQQQIIEKILIGDYHTELQNALEGGIITQYKESLTNTPIARDAEGIFSLLKNGLVVQNDPVLENDKTYFLSVDMVRATDELIKSLQAAGVVFENDGNGGLQLAGPITKDHILNWKNLAVSSDVIGQILSLATERSSSQNRTLQALVELIYVKTGNEILTNSLEDLETALSSTKSTLETLNRLQDLHNKITAKDKEKFSEAASATYGLGPTAFIDGSGSVDSITEAADQHFNYIDAETLDLTNADIAEFQRLRDLIRNEEIPKLEGITPRDSAGNLIETGTLLEKMRQVLANIDLAFEDAGAGDAFDEKALKFWILDGGAFIDDGNGNPVANTLEGLEPGDIQRTITTAITAAQSLNDSQKEEVRRYLFVFEEYYKSAAAVLSKITQLIERMAQGIAR